VLEAAVRLHEVVQHPLAGMTERRVAEVVRQRHGFGEVAVEAQRLGDGARDLRGLHRVREPSPVVVALVVYEHLGLVLESAKRGAVDDPIAIALERHAKRVLGLAMDTASAGNAVHGVRRQQLALERRELFPAKHAGL
jgi:hypothetical protein